MRGGCAGGSPVAAARREFVVGGVGGFGFDAEVGSAAEEVALAVLAVTVATQHGGWLVVVVLESGF